MRRVFGRCIDPRSRACNCGILKTLIRTWRTRSIFLSSNSDWRIINQRKRQTSDRDGENRFQNILHRLLERNCPKIIINIPKPRFSPFDAARKFHGGITFPGTEIWDSNAGHRILIFSTSFHSGYIVASRYLLYELLPRSEFFIRLPHQPVCAS